LGTVEPGESPVDVKFVSGCQNLDENSLMTGYPPVRLGGDGLFDVRGIDKALVLGKHPQHVKGPQDRVVESEALAPGECGDVGGEMAVCFGCVVEFEPHFGGFTVSYF
jgi:hypothetical protein